LQLTSSKDELVSLAAADPFFEDWQRDAWDEYLENERYQREMEYGFSSGFE
jgi:hypothetical protein